MPVLGKSIVQGALETDTILNYTHSEYWTNCFICYVYLYLSVHLFVIPMKEYTVHFPDIYKLSVTSNK